jgi:Sortase domain
MNRLAWRARRDTARRSLPLLLPLFTLAVIAALAAGTMLIVSGAQSHAPPAAPLPARQFAIDPGALGPLPPLKRGGSGITDTTGTGWSGKPCTVPVTSAHLVIGSVCVDGPIVPTYQRSDGALVIPSDVHDVGMWDGGAQLSGPDGKPLNQGTTLLAGHVDYVGQGAGALYNLYLVKPGAIVYTADAAGRVTRWRVTGLAVVQKSELPSWVFAGPTGPRRLVIVTCGGPVQYSAQYGNSYLDNVIATAVPA